MINKNVEYGLVFGGGGSKGAYQIGAWRAFNELDIKFKGVVGTSIGALHAALFAQGDYKQAIKIWQELTYSQVLDVNDNEFDKLLKLNYKDIDIYDFARKIKNFTRRKGFDTAAIKELIRSNLREEEIRKNKMELGLVTYCLSDLKPMELFLDDIKEGQLADYLLASAYLPIFKRDKLNGKYFLDGGFHSVVPTELLVNKGYKNIIVVKVGGPGVERKVNIDGINVITIEPAEDLGRVVEVSKEKSAYNIKLGYYDTMKVLKDLSGEYYYIRCKKREKYFLSRLLRMKRLTMMKFVRGLINTDYPLERYLMEQGLPALAKKLKLSNDWTYKEMVITIVEVVAKVIGIERFAIYDYDVLLEMIKNNIETYKVKVEYEKHSTDMYHILADIIQVL